MSEADKRNLMAIDDLGDELGDIIDWAIAFKHGGEFSRDFKPLDGMSIGSIYEKPSTRTRVSFEVGVSRLGGQPLTLLSNDIQLGKVSQLLILQLYSLDSWMELPTGVSNTAMPRSWLSTLRSL